MTGRDLRARSSVMTATEKQQAGSNHLSNHSSNVQRGRLRNRLPCGVVSLEAPSSKVRRRSVCHLWQNFPSYPLDADALSSWSSAPACQSTISWSQCFCQRAAVNAPVGLGINMGEDRRVGRPKLKTQTDAAASFPIIVWLFYLLEML